MDLDYCKDHPDTMYLASSTRGGKRPAKRIRKKYDHTGGVFKSLDGGYTWRKTGDENLAGAVEVAVHPHNPDIVYAAVVGGTGPDKKKMAAGIHKTMDGGKTWKRVLPGEDWLPEKRKQETAEPASIAVNPVLPDIVYAVIKYAGVIRSVDAGATWERVDWEHLKRYQGSYHTLTINPHDPAEFYLSLFGNSFLAYRDPVADIMLKEQSTKKNQIRNGDFELTDNSGKPVHWIWNNLSYPNSAGSPVLSIEDTPGGAGKSLRINLGKGALSNQEVSQKAQTPITWLSYQMSPYSVSSVRGRKVKIRYDVYAKRAKFQDLPVLSLVEVTNVQKEISAELPAALGFTHLPYDSVRITSGNPAAEKWISIESHAQISENVNTLKVILFTTSDSEPVDIFIDNIEIQVNN
jgi:hypothetical protein